MDKTAPLKGGRAAFVLETVFEHGSPRHDCLADFVSDPCARFQPREQPILCWARKNGD